MIIYNRLWKLLDELDISQYALINYYGFSPSQLTRLKRNDIVKTSTIDHLCEVLNCSVSDIMEYVKTDDEKDGTSAD